MKADSYSLPFRMIAARSQIPISAAARNPMIPITEIPTIRGGVSEMTIRADPTISPAMTMLNAIRLLIWSWVASICPIPS